MSDLKDPVGPDNDATLHDMLNQADVEGRPVRPNRHRFPPLAAALVKVIWGLA